MRRICCFCESWKSGGIESFLCNMLLYMDLTDMEVDIVAACIKDSVFTAGLKAKGVRFVELSGKLRSTKNYRRFRELLIERKYDVIHFNLFHGLSLYYAQIAKEEGVLVRIAHSHGAGLRNSRTKELKMLLHRVGCRLWATAATDHWACSHQAAEFLFSPKTIAENEWQLIPNGIEISRFLFSPEDREQIRRELGIGNCFLVGTVGRISQEKNHSFLLDIFYEVLKIRSESRLILVGEGEEETALKQKALDLAITDKVIFYGVSNHVEKLLWAMDAFVFPSCIEGFGIAAIEAQAAGLPTFCSERVPDEVICSELSERIDLGDGAKVWANHIIDARYTVRQKQFVPQLYDVVTVSQKLYEKYKNIG